jgi:hypothetical protein
VQGFLKQPKERSRAHLWSRLDKEGRVHFLGAFFEELACIAREELAKCTGSIVFTVEIWIPWKVVPMCL